MLRAVPRARALPLTLALVAAVGGPGCPMSQTPRSPAVPSSPAGWPALDEGFIAQYAATFGFRLGMPKEIAFAPDGDVLFTRTEARGFVADLYEWDAATGAVRTVLTAAALIGGDDEALSPQERARRERLRQATRGISGYQLSEDGATLLVPVSDRLFVVDRGSGAARELPTGDGYPYDPRLSRDARKVAYVVDGDLRVIDVASGKVTRLTTREADTTEHGVAEFVAQEEMGRTRGHWWSPDGAHLAFQRTDVAPVDTLWVADPSRPDRAPTPFRYPRAGRPDAEVTLGVVPVGGGKPTWIAWDRARYPYLCRVTWQAGAPLTLVVMNEAQTGLAVLAADVAAGTTSVLLTETDPAYLELMPGMGMGGALPRWRRDGSGFWWMSERSGHWQLELRKADGALDRVLFGGDGGVVGAGDVLGISGIDEAGEVAWVTTAPTQPEQRVWQVPLVGAPREVTGRRGVHDAYVATGGGGAVVVTSDDDGAVAFTVWRDGAAVGTLPAVAEAPPWWPTSTWETVTVDGREHHAVITRPRAAEPARRYPVLLHVYGGPHARKVLATPRSYLLDQWYADAGFVVVSIEGRGTPGRGRDWERAIHKDLATVPLADQVGALRALGARHADLDLDRVGIMGWSFGGYLAAMAVVKHPEVFRAASAGAPVTDWALYDTFYTERYMQTPEANPAGYEAASVVAHAPALTRPLQVIHGTTDDNVHFAHAMALVEALFRAGKPVELLPVAATHMTPDPEIALALARARVRFFREHLGQ